MHSATGTTCILGKPQPLEPPLAKVEFENELIRARHARMAPQYRGPMHRTESYKRFRVLVPWWYIFLQILKTRCPRILPIATFLVFLSCGLPSAKGQHQHQQYAQSGDIGSVHFPVSCAPRAQKAFDRAIALLHSFWYDEAEKTFIEGARADPSCGMAWWGVAMSLYHPIWTPPTPAELKQGAEAVEKAQAAGVRTQRERDYIAAIEV